MMRTIAIGAATLVLATGIVAGQPASPAAAISGGDFNPGLIISDSNFYNPAALTQPQIQAFLDAKIGPCSNLNCLDILRVDTISRGADRALCGAYAGGSQELASMVIFKVQQACGISAKALLVLLQKEQGLVTNTGPSDTRINRAVGYGCPDTAACNEAYSGFAKQMYWAAWQFKRYAVSPYTFNFYAGRSSTVQFHPKPELNCGSSVVNIQNNATAALYNYTPYQPNAAALANLRGEAACGAYGNRNFWVHYNDWFGDPTASSANFVKVQGGNDIFLISGLTKYRVPSMAVYSALAVFGGYREVDSSYLAMFGTSSKVASELIRNPGTGEVSLMQGSSRASFPSCGLVTAYSYSCADAIDLSGDLFSRFASSGAVLTPFVVESGTSAVFNLAGGTKRPVPTWGTAIALNNGVSPFVATLRSDVAARITTGQPIMAPNTLVRESTNPAVFLVDGAASKVPVSAFAIAAEFGVSGYTTVPDGWLGGYATTPAALSIVVSCAGQTYLASSGALIAWQTTDAAGLPVAPLQAETCARTPRAGTLSGALFVKASGSPTVYLVSKNQKRALSYEEFMAAGGGSTRIVDLSVDTLSLIQNAPVAIPAGTMVKAPDSPDVFVIDAARRVRVGSFTTTNELGITQLKSYTASDVARYTVTMGEVLSRSVTCSAVDYFAAGGRSYALKSGAQTGITPTKLDQATCATLAFSTSAALPKVFVKDPAASTVYHVTSGKRQVVSSWQALLALNGGTEPQILVSGPNGLADIPVS